VYKASAFPHARLIENDGMTKRHDDIEVIEYVPKRQGLFRWWFVAVLIGAWVLVLLGAFFLKMTMFRVMLPALMVVLLVYLMVCTLIAMRRK
jgi:hypothetical protein